MPLVTMATNRLEIDPLAIAALKIICLLNNPIWDIPAKEYQVITKLTEIIRVI